MGNLSPYEEKDYNFPIPLDAAGDILRCSSDLNTLITAFSIIKIVPGHFTGSKVVSDRFGNVNLPPLLGPSVSRRR
jgi:hypothetical protein